jgi:hypothetical protein
MVVSTAPHATGAANLASARAFDDAINHVRRGVVRLYTALIAINVGAWIWAFVSFHSYLSVLATGYQKIGSAHVSGKTGAGRR